MSEDTEISNELEKVDLRGTLRIPGEYFFTETIQLAESIPTGGEDINRLVENYLLEILEDPSFLTLFINWHGVILVLWRKVRFCCSFSNF